ncbi:TadE family protein [Microbacterium sp. JZ31]|uniref:TadE family protein n=1 Tax=Microbacterium sp. JZ31 TaxID=1906274 RepID=UPI0019312945|nr:TadE family protein [Microbacterium sp. JZ31]
MRRTRALTTDDSGSAALEFLTVGVLMLVPLVYLVLALGQIQAQALGVEAGARFAARTIAGGAGNPDAVLASVTRQYGIEAFDADVACVPATASCPEPGATVHVTVTTRVPLPLMPSMLGLDRMTSVPVQATAVQKVSRYWEAQ